MPETEIIVTTDGTELLRKIVQSGDYVIGREAACEVQVEAELVSRRHARLAIEFDHVLIEDLGSSNGTFVDGKRIKESTRLWPKQKIQIGAATIEVRWVEMVLPSGVSPAQAAVQRLLPGDLLRENKYAIGKVVARGGMGAILDARDAATQRGVAMKVMLDGSSPDFVARFIAEARVTAQLEHPNIVPVHELSIDQNGQPFYTMKMVRGVTLMRVIELLCERDVATVRKNSLPTLLTIFQKVCDAIAFAHAKGVIHRDLKPENIMLGDFGEVLVMDWGLARLMDKKVPIPGAGAHSSIRHAMIGAGDVTLDGTIMGTPRYMSPEQARGELESLDGRSDIYSLGAILYHLLALRPSVAGRTPMEIVTKVQNGEIEALGQGGGDHLPGGRIPNSLLAVVHKAMALDRDDRYPSVAELQADLTAYQTGFATTAENAGAWKQLTLLVRRHRVAATAIAASLLLIAGVSMLYAINLQAALIKAEQATAQANSALRNSKRTQAEAEARKLQAEKASAEAIEARQAAVQSLAQLKQTAPAIFDGAKGLVQEHKFAEALTRVNAALSLDPANPEYHFLKAKVLQTVEQLQEAAAGFGAILSLRTDEAVRLNAEANRQLCLDILRDNGPGNLTEASLSTLAKALEGQGRDVEANWLKTKGAKGAEQAEALIKKQLNGPLGRLPGFAWKDRLKLLPDNTFLLNLGNLVITQVPNLQNLPISELHLGGTAIKSLEALQGLPLKRLWIGGTGVSDLSPLAGLPLTELDVSATQVSSFAALRGSPIRVLYARGDRQLTDLVSLSGLSTLESLYLDQTNCADVAPLAGLQSLRVLWLSETRIEVLNPLRLLALEELVVEKTRIQDKDLAIACHLPLRRLSIRHCRDLRSLAAVAACRTLETLALPDQHTNFLGVRLLPNLQRLTDNPLGSLDFSTIPLQQAFWEMHSYKPDEMAPANEAVETLSEPGKPRPQWLPTVDGKMAFDMQGLEKSRLESLRGLPIQFLDAYNTPVSDFSPLAGAPLQYLSIGGPQHLKPRNPAAGSGEDYHSLSKLGTLRHLYIGYTDFSSLEPLVGLPLETLLIPGTRVTDISPLLKIPTLRTVVLPRGTITNLPLLRAHPRLEFISYGADVPSKKKIQPFRDPPYQRAQQFWAEFK